MSLIEVRNLNKEYQISMRKKGLLGALKNILIPEYKVKNAVKDINFSIEKGEIVGFIGPNGAGKSTTVKMLTGILHPTSGSISIDGLSPHKDRKKNAYKIGVVFGQRTQLWWDLPVIDTYELLRCIYRVPKKTFKDNLDMFNSLLDLEGFMHQPVRQLSLGQRMRADIAAAFLHNPEIIFFDEPTIGLDVVAKEKIREFIKVINRERHTTMLFTTHDMGDIEKTCGRMIIIDDGTIIYDGTVEQIKDVYGKTRTLLVEFDQKCVDLNYPGVEVSDAQGNKKSLKFNKEDVKIAELIAWLLQNYTISDLTVTEPEIENIIIEIYQGGLKRDKSVYGIC